jgi:hypothetical protein
VTFDSVDRYVFAVLDDPYCVVEFDLLDINRRFLRNIDAAYFSYLATVHAERLDGDDRHRAAIALRTAYHHGIETLLTLLGAYVQAPLAVAAWIPRCWPHHLRELVTRFQNGATLLTPTGKVQYLFEHLSGAVHAGAWSDDAEREEFVAGFARVWAHFAYDLADPLLQDEYNSIKHGFRVGAGGFVLRGGLQTEPGVAAPEENMQTIGGSEFGSHFHTLEGRDSTRASRSALEFRLGSRAINWPVERMVHSLSLLAMSIHNVVSKLLLMSGEPSELLSAQRPVDLSAFDQPWRYSPGVTSSSFRIHLPWDEIETCTRESLLDELNPMSIPPVG